MANTPFPEDAIDCGYYPGSLGAINVQDESEPQERYDEGLYYPVSIGETLAGRYRIEHKLGWGGFSTVWMAYDNALGRSVALKIMTPGEDGDHEFQIQNEIGRAVRDTSNLITHRGGSFGVSGRNGIYHQVLVLPLVGPSLGLRLPNMPIRARMSAAKQLLVALKTFHEAGFIHRGEQPIPMSMSGADESHLLILFFANITVYRPKRRCAYVGITSGLCNYRYREKVPVTWPA